MQNTFEEIRRQIHEIRNFLAPFDLKLSVLDERIAETRVFFEQKIGQTESATLANSLKIEEQGLTIMELLERVNLMELLLKIPPRPKPVRTGVLPSPSPAPLPAHEDKIKPEILPPQNPSPYP
jgi:hypothetical protein